MGPLTKVLFVFVTLGTSYALFNIYGIFADDPVPEIKDEFWGPGSSSDKFGKSQKLDESIRPFKVDFTSPAILNDLKARLKMELGSGYTPPLEGVGFKWGFNTKYLQTVLNYWLEKYDFAAREKYLNRYPHFKTKIGGLDIHYQLVKPKAGGKKYKKTVPVIMFHGWPGSFVEYQKLIDFFVEPMDSEINFELIVPSLPGYGYSDGASRNGLATVNMANIFGRLMKRLGYAKYFTLGEDWGSMISTDMGILYPDRVLGVHFECYSLHPMDQLKQILLATVSSSSAYVNKRAEERFHPWSRTFAYSVRESGYLHIQATKPDTVGVGLTQSPSGLAAYVLEKFATWTNESYMESEDGGLLKRWTMEELLDNVMVYWTSKSITTSMRLYSESLTRWNTLKVPVPVPSACTATPEDCIFAAEFGLSSKYPNLKQYTPAPEGGHFASYEIPQIVAKEAIKFFNGLESTKK